MDKDCNKKRKRRSKLLACLSNKNISRDFQLSLRSDTVGGARPAQNPKGFSVDVLVQEDTPLLVGFLFHSLSPHFPTDEKKSFSLTEDSARL